MMEAATLQKKKTTISKGKLKKTMKNILCRPDTIFWPQLSAEHSSELEKLFQNFKVVIPEFTKPSWSELKAIPKEQRPKAPKIEKVNGLLFGISLCTRSIPHSCDGIIINADVNPRILVQHLIESCVAANIPVLCLKDLKKISSSYFGFPTSCLGVKKDCVTVSELRNKIHEISKIYKRTEKSHNNDVSDVMKSIETPKSVAPMESKPQVFTYLHRTSKKSRVFTPPSDNITKKTKGFIGQDFIEFSESEKRPTSKQVSYMKMIVKRVTNNPNRIKK